MVQSDSGQRYILTESVDQTLDNNHIFIIAGAAVGLHFAVVCGAFM